jgi:hypothetical protein
MERKNQEERQEETDRRGNYGDRLERYFRKHWKAYGVIDVSVIVLGQRGGGEKPVEIVYSISVHSRFAIPHAGEGHSLKHGKNRFTFVQLANSVFTDSYNSLAAGRYTGSDPPTSPP